MVVVLAGGVGAARFLVGLVQVEDPHQITAVVNTGDDLVLHGLHISPDIDTVTYTLAGLSDETRGWGLAGESWTVMEELEALGGEAWFRLGDRDLATHLFRSQRLGEGGTLSQVTTELARARGVDVRVLPMSDDPVRTMITLAENGASPATVPGAETRPAGGANGTAGVEISFQQYFVGLRHAVAVQAVRFDGAEQARPAPGVLAALADAETVVICPSNPVVSIGPILAVPGLRPALESRRPDVVAISPIVAGAALKGPADRLLRELGHEASVVGVARLYAPIAATLVIDQADADRASEVEAQGVRCVVTPTVMSTPELAAGLAETALGARA